MADGGIAVSGGATNHGTLIHTNLLYYPLLYDAYGNQQARPSFVLGGTAGVAGYEAAFAVDKDPKTLFKPAASVNDQEFTIDLGAGNALVVYGVVIVGHNITAANIDSALFEGGTTTGYADVSEALTLNVATLSPAYHLLASPQAYRYWRVRVNFTASLALQMGEVFLIGAAPYAFADNYNKGFTPDLEFGKVSGSGIAGIPRVYTRWERKRYSLQFTSITDAQLTVFKNAARNGHVIFSPKGANGPALFGVWEIEPPKYITEVSGGSVYDVTVNFTEAAR